MKLVRLYFLAARSGVVVLLEVSFDCCDCVFVKPDALPERAALALAGLLLAARMFWSALPKTSVLLLLVVVLAIAAGCGVLSIVAAVGVE